ncbi:hypothetical protein HYW55_06875 [Candidatus Gottesmanbacteria bacterium]|nr:hypothetical protein [Candidatus Gottesmanbacteria bacterium]
METSAYQESFRQLGKKEKLGILALLLLAFVVGFIAAFVYLKPQLKFITGEQSQSFVAKDRASLTLSTKTLDLSPNSEFEVAIHISAQEKGVEAADVILYYDPRYIRAKTIIRGNYFPTFVTEKIEENRIKLAATASFQNQKIKVPKGNGTIAVIQFETIEPTETTLIYFDPDRTILASAGENTLDYSNVLKLTIQ